MKFEQWLLIFGIGTAGVTVIGAIGTAYFSYKVYRRDQDSAAVEFQTIVQRFEQIGSNLQQQELGRNAQFKASLERLSSITNALKYAEERNDKELKIRLGASVRRLFSIMQFWTAQHNAESPDNRKQLIANAVEMTSILEREMLNPHLTENKKLYERWAILCGTLQTIKGKEGNYQFVYKDVFDEISGAFNDFRNFSNVYGADLEGNILSI